MIKPLLDAGKEVGNAKLEDKIGIKVATELATDQNHPNG
jgi:hypothetical protein